MKKSILFVFHSSDFYSGGTRSLLDIITYLQLTEKYDIYAIFPRKMGTASAYLESIGINKICVFYYGTLMQDLSQSLIKRIFKIPLLLYRYLKIKKEANVAAKYFKAIHVDLIYSNTSSIIFGGLLGLALKCKQVWHIREYRIKDHRISFFLGERWIKTFINKCSQKVFYVSSDIKKYNSDIIEFKKGIVTYNSFSKDFISPRNVFNTDRPLNILVAGTISKSKGQLEVVKAVGLLRKEHPDITVFLYIAGNGNMQSINRIREVIDAYELNENVFILGHVKEMYELRKKMDVGVISSVCEAFARTTLEGMLSMMTMIGRNTGGTVEQIADGKNGLLYDGTSEDLCKKILLLHRNRDIMKKLSINGYTYAIENFTNNEAAKIVEKNIDEILH